MNLLAEIDAIVMRERSTDSHDREIQRIHRSISQLQGIDTRDLGARRFREYEIDVGEGDGLKEEAEALAWMRTLEIAAAPEVAALVPIRDGYLLVRRYWACTGEQLLPVRSANVSFQAHARVRFRQDMERLADLGKVHPYAPRGYAHWFAGETSGTIVLNAWAQLKPISPRERVELFESIDELLARRSKIEVPDQR